VTTKTAALWLGCATAVVVAVAGCDTTLVGPDGGVGDCSGDFGGSAAGTKLQAFVSAAGAFSAQAQALDAQLHDACVALGHDLGLMDADLAAPAGSDMTATQAACARVAQEVHAQLAALRAEPGVTVFVAATAPECTVDVQAYSDCVARCDATYTPATSTLMCTGGEIRGGCSGACTGRCAVMASGACAGTCDGACMGGCTGTCQGTCDGTCAARDAQGNCNGACTGTCHGTCSAGCAGGCTGSCVAMASGTCAGECRGACSVAWTTPTCTGTVTPPMADVDCRASCDAQVDARATCSDPSVELVVIGTLSTTSQARETTLATALQHSYGDVLTVARALALMADGATSLATAAMDVPTAVRSLGLGAAACATQSANDVQTRAASLQVTVQVSVSVTASVAP
jgi:hypothetical protein